MNNGSASNLRDLSPRSPACSMRESGSMIDLLRRRAANAGYVAIVNAVAHGDPLSL